MTKRAQSEAIAVASEANQRNDGGLRFLLVVTQKSVGPRGSTGTTTGTSMFVENERYEGADAENLVF